MSVADVITPERIASGVKVSAVETFNALRKCLPKAATAHELYDLLSRWQSGVIQRAAIFHA